VKVAQGSERNGKTPTAERDGRNKPSGTMSSSAQIGTQIPERNETGCLRAADSLTTSEILSAAKAIQGKLPIMLADISFLREEYTASKRPETRRWKHVSTAVILRLGAERAHDCIRELRRPENLLEEIRNRFEKARGRELEANGAKLASAGSFRVDSRTPHPCREGKANEESKRTRGVGERGNAMKSRPFLLSFVSFGKKQTKAAERRIEADSRRGLSFCRFSPRACAMCACVRAYIREIFLLRGIFNFFTFSEKKDKRTKNHSECRIETDSRIVLSQKSNENKGQKDKRELKGYGLKIKEATGTVLVWLCAGMFGLLFWGALFACWQLGATL